MSEPWRQSARELGQAIATGELSAGEALASCLARARQVDAALNCFIEFDEVVGDAEAERGRRRRLDRRVRARPVAGVPFAYKDIFARAGRSPSGGAEHGAGDLGAPEATVLTRLERDSGAVAIGALNLDEYSYAATGMNRYFGDVANPWEPARITGGSSSGAAAAVAAGAVPFAIGSDTGGSVRIPAALCGVVGFKPTFGRLPRTGTLPLCYAQDTVGILTRSALDAALVLEHIAGFDPADPGSLPVATSPYLRLAEERVTPHRPLAGLRLGVDRDYLWRRSSPEVAAAAEAALGELASLGASEVAVDLSCFDRYDAAASVLTWSEVRSVHGDALAREPGRYGPTIRRRLGSGGGASGADHVTALRLQGFALREFLAGPLAEADLLLAPVIGATAPPRLLLEDGSGAEAERFSIEVLSLNRPANFVGAPAISLPAGFDEDGLPIGMQLIGRPWSEVELLTCAAAYQTVTDWHQRRPEVEVAGAHRP